MSQLKKAVEYEAEIDEIDAEMESLQIKIRELQRKRSNLSDKRKCLDIAAALECVESLGLSVDDVLDLLNKELTNKRYAARASVAGN
ncbi:MAG: hypothetical protein FWH57_08805 [Oscillospiraceae bacterium]|nr:hypothetical protein [Oscillospiraceae bacterium]